MLYNIRGRKKDEKIIQFTFFSSSSFFSFFFFTALQRSVRKSCSPKDISTWKTTERFGGKCWHYHHVCNHLNGCDVCHASDIMFHTHIQCGFHQNLLQFILNFVNDASIWKVCFYLILEIKLCGLCSGNPDLEAFWYKAEIKTIYFVLLCLIVLILSDCLVYPEAKQKKTNIKNLG